MMIGVGCEAWSGAMRGIFVGMDLLFCAGVAHAGGITVRLDYENPQIELTGVFDKPGGNGPFPTVILLHGCSGGDAYSHARSESWAKPLHEQGYATLILDSFWARGFSSVCKDDRLVSGMERAKDVYAAAYVLAARPDVWPDRITAAGFSHGGGTVLDAAADWSGLKPWGERLATRGKLVAIIGFYPGAHHDFDVDHPAHEVFGHHLAYNAAAAQDARVEVVDFLWQYPK